MNPRELGRRARRRLRNGGDDRRVDTDALVLAQADVASTLDEQDKAIIREVRMLTMLSVERLVANIDAVRYAVARGVPGAIVECGVWRGGSTLAMIRALQSVGVDDRDIYLYDTFEGMTKPGDADSSAFETHALERWEQTPDDETPWGWAFDASIYDLDFVKRVMAQSGYPANRIHLVAGPVEQTIPGVMPDQIAVLRLDTDWYESTRHELLHLYPVVSPGGVLIIDDFGHWDGARRAVEEYFSTEERPILLSRTDYTGRVGVKG